VRQSTDLGNALIESLAKFHTATGHYPDSLQQLVPEYRDTIPSPTAGNTQWIYSSSPRGFTLAFAAADGDYPVMRYTMTPTGGGWTLDQ
jgi:hypothetical protein